MPISLRIFSPSSSLRPALACEITPEGVIAGRQDKAGQALMSFAPLPEAVVMPGLAEPNFSDPSIVVSALRTALDEVSARARQLTLVIPDAAVRVLILDFDTLPPKAQDALPIVRFRLRKLTPFEVDDAAVSYQIIHHARGGDREQTRALVTVMPSAVLAEYEGAVRAAGYEPGVVLPSTLASLAALTTGESALVVNRNGLSVTTAITSGDDLLLHRTLELPPEDEFHHEDLAQSVSVALAYFEDTLKTSPETLYYVGPGGAAGFLRIIGPAWEEAHLPRVRDLVNSPTVGVMGTIPKGLAAGVVGALVSG